MLLAMPRYFGKKRGFNGRILVDVSRMKSVFRPLFCIGVNRLGNDVNQPVELLMDRVQNVYVESAPRLGSRHEAHVCGVCVWVCVNVELALG